MVVHRARLALFEGGSCSILLRLNPANRKILYLIGCCKQEYVIMVDDSPCQKDMRSKDTTRMY